MNIQKKQSILSDQEFIISLPLKMKGINNKVLFSARWTEARKGLSKEKVRRDQINRPLR